MAKWHPVLAEFILSGGERKTLDEMLKEYGVSEIVELENAQKQKLEAFPSLYSLYTQVDAPLVEILATMKEAGVFINCEKLKELQEAVENERRVFAKRIADRLGDINPSSPKQLGSALFEKLKLPLQKTATGQYATSSELLEEYSPLHPVVSDILAFRLADKVINTYILPILEKTDSLSRIHPEYDLTKAATGRIASSNPNIQSTPVGPPYGDKIRDCFQAPDGALLIGLDYSQQELRILAHLSQDKRLIEAFRNHEDIHVLTASNVLGIKKDAVTKQDRAIGKTLNFGIMYGETPFGLAKQLKKSVAECTHILNEYYKTYAGVKTYFDNLLTHAKINGKVETMAGRVRGIPGKKLGEKAKFLTGSQERILRNFPIQGSAADMTKKAMIAIHNEILPHHPEAILIMQIHDELVFEFANEDAHKAGAFADKVKHVMENVYSLHVPVVADSHVGKSWAQV